MIKICSYTNRIKAEKRVGVDKLNNCILKELGQYVENRAVKAVNKSAE